MSSESMTRTPEQWEERYGLRRPEQRSGGPRWGLLITGLAVAGLGILAWNYLGPDLRRYIKISRM
jgi:hypothetical protein